MTSRRRNRRTTREKSRDAMLELLERRGIHDRCVLAAMTYVPREPFVSGDDVLEAYADHPLAIGHGQTLSQPYIVALMLQALQLQGNEHVLEIGTGSGYTTAVLSELAAHVYTVERDPMLASTARARLVALGYDGIDVTCHDGTLGWIEHAPYDAIVVAAGGPEIPDALIEQLAVGGRLVMPVGSRHEQILTLVIKTADRENTIKQLGAVACVPLVGVQGFPEPDRLDSE